MTEHILMILQLMLMFGGGILDIFLDYSIIGMSKIAHGIEDYETWCFEMLEEYGEEISLFLPGIYAQSQEMLEMDPEDLDSIKEDIKPVKDLYKSETLIFRRTLNGMEAAGICQIHGRMACEKISVDVGVSI